MQVEPINLVLILSLVAIGAGVVFVLLRTLRRSKKSDSRPQTTPKAQPKKVEPPSQIQTTERVAEEPKPTREEKVPEVQSEPEPDPEPEPAAVVEPSLEGRLTRTRSAIFGKLGKFLKLGASSGFSNEQWEEIEEGLLEADVGFQTVSTILDRVRENSSKSNGASLQELIQKECCDLFPTQDLPGVFRSEQADRPFVLSIVGVNGVGKTTSIGKIAHRLKGDGKSLLLGAADTFRAGATSQLQIWAERVGAQFVKGREGGDPGAVAFDSLSAAKAREIDVVLLDTAGRLHTKSSLMDELKKVHRVMKKVIPEAPHETWLVLDGTIGQNSIEQAREFCKTLDVTGLVVTKLDGTAKGGALIAIASELKLPVHFIGIGEGVQDMIPFQPDKFVQAILG